MICLTVQILIFEMTFWSISVLCNILTILTSNHDITLSCCSGLLFLIVASDTQAEGTRAENTQAEDPSFQSEKNETYGAYSNITLNYDNLENNFGSTILNTERQDTDEALKTSQDDQYHQVRYLYNFLWNKKHEYRCMYNLLMCYIVLQEEATTVSASFETITSDNAQVQDILAESLTQQPNLSQG